ncbi:T6SS effector amidase Tae4 family protein [uncultured Chryseobacterium sp.]|uniref:T6SS effector amidase Tae4 family protein n=1 Tax=uncultured Chryseobacterium sp. TaxID=259322 RepID=UPI002631F427|nr:T6SS effector amidase Tae4 family protein [uncultured Chryseobacterium sp.]
MFGNRNDRPASLIAAIDHCVEGSTGGGGGIDGGVGGEGSGGGTGGSTNPDAYNTFIFFSFDDMFNICPDGDAGCQAETQLNIQVQQYLLSLPPHVSSLASYNGVLFTIKDYFRTMGYGDDVLTQNLTHIATWFNAQNNTAPTVKLNNFKFANFALNFLIQNPETNWLEFESWFITKSNGSDGEYISNLDDILNTIQYQTKQMPTYSQFVNAFPKLDYPEYPGYYKQMPASQVYSIVGDPLKSLYLSTGGDNGNYRNACTVRWSLAMNNLGILIPQNSLSLRGADVNGQPRYYYIRATTAGDAMQKIFGNPTHKLEGAEANDAVNVAKFLDGKTGIYVIINANSTLAGYTGHVDLIQNGYIPGGSNHTNVPGGIKSIRIWEFTP